MLDILYALGDTACGDFIFHWGKIDNHSISQSIIKGAKYAQNNYSI